jgi:hypothetical protein
MPAPTDYSVTNLVTEVRRRAMIPNSTQVLTDTDIVAFLNDELREYVVPMLMATTEEYLVAATEPWTPETTTIDLDIATDYRAVGLKIRTSRFRA